MTSDARDGRPPAAIEALQKHDFYVYDLNLQLKWSPSGNDILRKLQESATYIVDNNVSWKALAVAYPAVNFVIGGTLSEEANDLEGVLFSKMPSDGYPNVFAAELRATETVGVVFNRLDKHYKTAVFAKEIPTLPNTSSAHRNDQLIAASSFRYQILENLHRAADELRQEMIMRAARSRGSYEDAALASVFATVLILQSTSIGRRKKKLDPSYVQLPGDTRLVAEALFYGFNIVSNDICDVHALGKVVGVAVVSEAKLRTQVSRAKY